MSLFDKLASELSGKKQTSSIRPSSAAKHSVNSPKQIWWQCRYCGRRTGTWSNSSKPPQAGICQTRGKTTTGFNKPHEWRKIG